MATLRTSAAALTLTASLAACTPTPPLPAPSAPPDAARARWVLVVSTHDDGVAQFRLGSETAQNPLAEIERAMKARFGGRVGEWIVSPDGGRVAFTAQVLDDDEPAAGAAARAPSGAAPTAPQRALPRTRGESFVVTTNGTRPEPVPIPDPTPRVPGLPDTVHRPLVWSADGTRLAYRELAWDAARATWADDQCLAVFDATTGRVERFSGVDARWSPGGPHGFAFSPDGTSLAFTKPRGGVAAVEFATRAVSDIPLPGGTDIELLAWLPDGRLACGTLSGGRYGRVVIARPGDATSVEFPTDPARDQPVSVRPDAGAVVCIRTRFSGFAAIPNLCVRYADGAWEDLEAVEGLRDQFPESVVWIPAPGLVPPTPR